MTQIQLIPSWNLWIAPVLLKNKKRIAAEEARLQERKAELDKLSKNFSQKKDEFSNKTWIYPKDKPKYRNRNATYCYFMKQNNEVRNFRFVFSVC